MLHEKALEALKKHNEIPCWCLNVSFHGAGFGMGRPLGSLIAWAALCLSCFPASTYLAAICVTMNDIPE